MEQQAREARNAYMRAWRAKNKEKEKVAQERYWKKKAKNLNGEGDKSNE